MASRAETPKMGVVKFNPQGGKYFAVAVREGSELFLTAVIKRCPEGDVYVLILRQDRDWNPHTTYHQDGTFHSKSFRRKVLADAEKRQPLMRAFRGCEHLGMFHGHGPKTVGAICDPALFSCVIEVAPCVLGPSDGFVAVDLVEPGCEPLELYHPIIQTEVFRDSIPWIVVRVGKKPAFPTSA